MLWINGVRMPDPQLNGITITKQKIWSSNTGRSSEGGMIGDVIARKLKLQITWPPLSDAEVMLIDQSIDPAFVSARFRNPATGSFVEMNMYAGDPSYPVYSYVDGVKTYQGVSVDLVEQ